MMRFHKQYSYALMSASLFVYVMRLILPALSCVAYKMPYFDLWPEFEKYRATEWYILPPLEFKNRFFIIWILNLYSISTVGIASDFDWSIITKFRISAWLLDKPIEFDSPPTIVYWNKNISVYTKVIRWFLDLDTMALHNQQNSVSIQSELWLNVKSLRVCYICL